MGAIAITLGILSAAMHLLAFWLYYRQMLLGTSRPKAASWLLWPVLTVLNCVIYLLSTGDWVKSLLPLASSAACLVIVAVALRRKNLKKPRLWEMIVMMAAIDIAVLYGVFNSAVYANLLIQTCVAISFIPTFAGVWKDSNSERPLPWFIWSTAYILALAVVILRWRRQPGDLIYPINCLVLHAVVGALTFKKNQAR
ncbi:MAG: hypothetical protein WC750_02075 [Patescibacteria group bacterium]|jgi:hypothetical protein